MPFLFNSIKNGFYRALLVVCLTGLATACQSPSHSQTLVANQESPEAFVERLQNELVALSREVEAAYWVHATYITGDTALLAAKAEEKYLAYKSQAIAQAKTYQNTPMPPATRKALDNFIFTTTKPAPSNAAQQTELATIATELEGRYGSFKACDDQGNCRDLGELEKTIAKSRDYQELLTAWQDWRQVSVPMRDRYQRMVELMNQGAREFGFADVGELWKSGYDMPVAEFEQEVERLWSQVEPLYEQLHCHVRGELSEFYGPELVPTNEPIPAHLLGNMWSQTWSNIYELVEPYPGAEGLDVTGALETQNYDALAITQLSESFFTSLGLPDLPESFYQNSLLEKPADRDVICHASAWDMDNGNDPRIKQCVEATEEQLTTMHHELGHIYYFLLYKDQPYLFKNGAHDGFHEAIGDTIVLAMTPEYYQKQGLAETPEKSHQATMNEQMRMALDKIAFLPFGKLIDQWRWGVFSGDITADEYNQRWWQLREQYQGIRAPIARSEQDFDPGAKYHIPANVPYTRYFLSFILQFQFYQALCDESGHTGPLHECSFYQSQAAGKKLAETLALGASQPWPEAMEKLTGTRTMDASALIEYFSPLIAWLEEQNQNRQCGW